MRYILVVILAIALMGCSTFQRPAVCQDASSAILSATQDNPTGLDRGLLTVNILALEKGIYTGEQAQAFIDDVREKVNSGISYLDLLAYLDFQIAAVNKAVGLTLIVLGPDVPAIAQLGGNDLVSDCDQKLMNLHLDRQELVISFYR